MNTAITQQNLKYNKYFRNIVNHKTQDNEIKMEKAGHHMLVILLV